jgi:hypothetical protein
MAKTMDSDVEMMGFAHRGYSDDATEDLDMTLPMDFQATRRPSRLRCIALSSLLFLLSFAVLAFVDRLNILHKPKEKNPGQDGSTVDHVDEPNAGGDLDVDNTTAHAGGDQDTVIDHQGEAKDQQGDKIAEWQATNVSLFDGKMYNVVKQLNHDSNAFT